jgi:hypothetical protein
METLGRPHAPASFFARPDSLQRTLEEPANANCFGTTTEIVVIERFSLDQEDAEHITPLSI